MKLNQAPTVKSKFRRDLPSELEYLAGAVPFIEVTCRAGGFLNAAFQEAQEAAQKSHKIALMEAGENKNKRAYAEAVDAAGRDYGQDVFAAIYDHCVIDWATNIQDDGKALAPTRANFLALAEVRIPAIREYMIDLSKHVENTSRFLREADEADTKN